MSDLFEESEDNLIVVDEHFDEEVEPEFVEAAESANLDARRRLEKMLEEKRLRDELDDFVDY